MFRHPRKAFVPASGMAIEAQNKRKNSLRGEEVSSFYKNVLASEPKRRVLEKKVEQDKLDVTEDERRSYSVKDLFEACEANDANTVRQCLRNGDVNVRDDYSWTPLMCAACAGSTEIVALLLDAGADASSRDRAGYTAYSLAAKKGHHDTARMLVRHRRESTERQNEREAPQVSRDQMTTTTFCDVCQVSHDSCCKRHHECSTLHQFSAGASSSVGTVYGIPECNRGFQMLLDGGWNRDRGLGPSGTGRKFPVKTVLKRDRLGLGAPGAEPARVTHRVPEVQDISKRKARKSTVVREENGRKRAAAVKQEVNLRLALQGL